MLLVIADTSPLRYLVEIGQIGILPKLFEKILIPSAVYEELRHPSTPTSVRTWAQVLPSWLEVFPVVPDDNDPLLVLLDRGERAAISLGQSLHADVILMDDRKGPAVATKKGFQVSGTLGLLTLAARRELLDLAVTLTGMCLPICQILSDICRSRARSRRCAHFSLGRRSR
jgi:predicted nucleic acid-binding protein